MKTYTIREAAEFLGLHKLTVHVWCQKGKINFVKLPNGHRRITEEELIRILPIKNSSLNKRKSNVLYCRVSTPSQKENLERQKQRLLDFASNKGIIVDLVLEDIASGMNFKRLNFLKLINLILDDKIEYLLIEFRDRLVRFGFPLIEHMCSYRNINLIVINNEQSNDIYKEISNDFIAIIHYFCMKLYGSRKAKQKQREIKNSISNNNEVVENIKEQE